MRKPKLREVMLPSGMSHSTTVGPMMNRSQSLVIHSLGGWTGQPRCLCLPPSARVFSEEALMELLGEAGPHVLERRRHDCLKETASDVFNYT